MVVTSAWVRSAHAGKNLQELLRTKADALLGVSSDAAAALAAEGVTTVFDLGLSRLFAQADSVMEHTGRGAVTLPTDLLDDSAQPASGENAGDLSLAALAGVSQDRASALEAAMAVSTIRELSLWPPRVAASQMVAESLGQSPDIEDAAAEKLRPRFGEYPTERVYYDALVMFGSTDSSAQSPLSGPLSLQPSSTVLSFGTPAIGALTTWSQSWYAQGITLGHMLHSLALAPGEATRIAVIDWSRRTSASTSERIDESEQLDNATEHSRSISEVQNAVADELQSGGSMASGWAKSKSKGKNLSASIGGGVAGAYQGITGVLGFGGGGSKSSQESESSFGAKSASWSIGTRSVMAKMTQNVNDRTEQHASSVRNRRATAVREVSQSEHEAVSTRVVANYNHMHAMTVQYYEVVQVYQVQAMLHTVRRVLFLPFEFLDFSGADAQDAVARYRDSLLVAALTPRVQELIIDSEGLISIRNAMLVTAPVNVGIFDGSAFAATSNLSNNNVLANPSGSTTNPTPLPEPVEPVQPQLRTFVRPGSVIEVLSGSAKLVGVSFDRIKIERVKLEQPGTAASATTLFVPSGSEQVDLPNPVPMRSLEGIQVSKGTSADRNGTMILHVESNGERIRVDVDLSLKDSNSLQKVAYLESDPSNRAGELHAHLQANRAYYTREVLMNLDSASLVQLFSGKSWNGQPLADQVEPRPVSVSGNFLVLKAPVELNEDAGLDSSGTTWEQLMRNRGLDKVDPNTRMVPIPTGGVFAEAVLGRSNSAEKLDITRFWNWQDSPIPLAPTEIAPITAGSRGQQETLTPGQLGAPVLNIQTPVNLPDPIGVGAAFGALQAGQMFRDMSGLAGTQAAAQAASANTLNAATAAGKINSDNFKTATDQAVAMGKEAADMWKTIHGKTGGSSGKESGSNTGSNVSTDGAKINHGRDLDERGVSGGGQGAPKSNALGAQSDGALWLPRSKNSGGDNVGSRELAFSDEAVAVSPFLLGAAAESLGGGANLVNAMWPPLLAGPIRDAVLINIVMGDLFAMSIPLMGSNIIPMDRHLNHQEFKRIYGAWTNSASDVYLVMDGLRTAYHLGGAGAKPGNIAKAMGEERAIAIFIMHHEVEHVRQFNDSGGHPSLYKTMLIHEKNAYSDDLTWLKTSALQHYMAGTLKLSAKDITSIIDFITNRVDESLEFITDHENETDEALLRQAMIDNQLLPATINGNANYTIDDLYKDKQTV